VAGRALPTVSAGEATAVCQLPTGGGPSLAAPSLSDTPYTYLDAPYIHRGVQVQYCTHPSPQANRCAHLPRWRRGGSRRAPPDTVRDVYTIFICSLALNCNCSLLLCLQLLEGEWRECW
jgi:hypothetical protein